MKSGVTLTCLWNGGSFSLHFYFLPDMLPRTNGYGFFFGFRHFFKGRAFVNLHEGMPFCNMRFTSVLGGGKIHCTHENSILPIGMHVVWSTLNGHGMCNAMTKRPKRTVKWTPPWIGAHEAAVLRIAAICSNIQKYFKGLLDISISLQDYNWQTLLTLTISISMYRRRFNSGTRESHCSLKWSILKLYIYIYIFFLNIWRFEDRQFLLSCITIPWMAGRESLENAFDVIRAAIDAEFGDQHSGLHLALASLESSFAPPNGVASHSGGVERKARKAPLMGHNKTRVNFNPAWFRGTSI